MRGFGKKTHRAGNRPTSWWLLIPIIISIGVAVVIGFGLYFGATGFPVAYYWFPFPFFPIIFGPIIILVVFGLRWFWWGCWGTDWDYYDPAMATLIERYIRGEITKEQLEQMTKDLRKV